MPPSGFPDLSGRTLLVAEDVEDSRDMLSEFLKACGARVLAVSNGLEALAVLDTATGIDAIVTDLAMPQMDGVELVRKLRGDARARSMPAIALTGFAEQLVDARSAGFDAVLGKPVDFDQLCGIIRALTTTR